MSVVGVSEFVGDCADPSDGVEVVAYEYGSGCWVPGGV